MGKDAGSPPPAPDYKGQAIEQGKINQDNARLINKLSRPDQVDAFGNTQSWQDLGNDQWSVNTKLGSGQQSIFDALQGSSKSLGQTAQGLIPGVQSALSSPMDISNIPGRTFTLDPSQYKTLDSAVDVPNKSLDTSNLRGLTDAGYQMGVDFSGLSALPGIDDFGAQRDAVTDAMYRRASASLDPQWQKSEKDLRTQLLNSGIREGSEAWNNEWNRLNNSKTGAYGDARDRALLAGGQEQSRMFADALAGRGQGVNEILSSGGFANQAANAANQYGLSAQGQEFSNALQGANFGNNAAQLQLAQELAKLGFNNQTALTGAQFGNDQRTAGINEEAALRQMPLDELMKVMSGASGGFQSPQFGNYQSANIAPTDVSGAGAMEGQDAQNRYNAKVAETNQKNQQSAALASTAVMAAAMFF